ncbi:MAG TPA: peptide chain release factor-like protein [Phycisphaerae bacterium]|nr:peptide chain release factor-like protein [Phycisphaerae bacterium]
MSDAIRDEIDYLALDDAALLAHCDKHAYKASGPGGQHRNKVSSAVRLRHRPTGVTAHGDDSRSQHENKAMAINRLRMNIALRLRRPVDRQAAAPPVVAECIFTPRGKAVKPGLKRLGIGRKDHRFWRVAAFLLDLLEAYEGRVSEAAAHLGISTSNLISVLKDDRHLLAAAQQIRKAHGHGPLK